MVLLASLPVKTAASGHCRIGADAQREPGVMQVGSAAPDSDARRKGMCGLRSSAQGSRVASAELSSGGRREVMTDQVLLFNVFSGL